MRLASRYVRWLAIGVLPMLGLLASAGTASAECGDHVHILPKGAAKAPEQPKAPCPCQGPMCDRAPDAPLAPAPASSAPTPPSDLLHTSADDPDSSHVRPFARDGDAVPIAGLTSIFDPPRA